jgi:hypothetical protein
VEVWVHYTNRGDREPLASPIGIGRRVRRRQTGVWRWVCTSSVPNHTLAV